MFVHDRFQKPVLIHESRTTRVFRAYNRLAEKEVVLKTPDPHAYKPWFDNLYDHEHSIISNLKSPLVQRPISIFRHNEKPVLELDYFNGKPLHDYAAKSSLKTDAVLRISILMSEVFIELHRNDIIHNNISPCHILVEEKESSIRLIDFKFASSPARETGIGTSPSFFGCDNDFFIDPFYISPEQTGKVNYQLDFRTDFYSLGLILYELLTGQKPFFADTYTDAVSGHIKGGFKPPSEVDDAIPEMLSDIVMTLLETNPDHRYQCALGLKTDLETCLKRFISTVDVKPFSLHKNFYDDKLTASGAFVGRKQEKEILNAYLNSDRPVGVPILYGPAGIGKTELALTLIRDTFLTNRFFLKADMQQGETVLARQIIFQLIDAVMTLPEPWKRKLIDVIQTEFYELNSAILRIIPEMSAFLSDDNVTEFDPSMNHELLFFTIYKMLDAVKEFRPVVFLDDLEKADETALKRIFSMISLASDYDAYFIGAVTLYEEQIEKCDVDNTRRENDNNLLKPLLKASNVMEKGLKAHFVGIPPLVGEEIVEMLSGVIRVRREDVLELSETVRCVTGGNPLYIRLFLQHLLGKRILRHDLNEKNWRCDLIAAKTVGDPMGIGWLMEKELGGLQPENRVMLFFSALIGMEFSLDQLKAISGRNENAILHALQPAIEKGWIKPAPVFVRPYADCGMISGKQYVFIHSFIHAKVLERNNANASDSLSHETGATLVNALPGPEKEQRLMEIASHLNQGLNRLNSDADFKPAVPLAEWGKINVRAGKTAYGKNLVQKAFSFFKAGLRIFSEPVLSEYHEMTASLILEYTRLSAFSGQYREAVRFVTENAGNMPSSMEKARLYEALLTGCLHAERYELAMKAGMKAVEILEGHAALCKETPYKRSARTMTVNHSRSPKNYGQFQNLGKGASQTDFPDDTTRKLDKCAALLNMPHDLKPKLSSFNLFMADILMKTIDAAFFADHEIWETLNFKLFHLVFAAEESSASAPVIIRYAVLLKKYPGKEQEAAALLKKGLYLSFDSASLEQKASSKLLYIETAQHAADDPLPLERLVKDAMMEAMASGSFRNAGLIAFYDCMHAFFRGTPLTYLIKRSEERLAFISQLNSPLSKDLAIGLLMAATALQSGEKAIPEFEYKEINEYQYIRKIKKSNSLYALSLFYILKAKTCCVRGGFDEALKSAKKAREYRRYLKNDHALQLLFFYELLSLISTYIVSGDLKKISSKKISDEIHQFEKQSLEMKGQRHLVPFLKALLLWDADDMGKAAGLFREAIALAGEKGFPHHRALIHRYAAAYMAKKGFADYARVHAHAAYKEFGFWETPCEKRDFPGVSDIMDTFPDSEDTVLKNMANYGNGNKNDMITYLMISRALYGRSRPEQIYSAFMSTALSLTGAESGALMIQEAKGLVIKATGIDYNPISLPKSHAQDLGIDTSCDIFVDKSKSLPKSLIYHAARNAELVAVNDFSRHPFFSLEPARIKEGLKSAIAAPISFRSRLIGLLYLEKRITLDGFSEEMKRAITIICAEMAGVCHNALMYEKLKKKVEEQEKAASEQKQSVKKVRRSEAALEAEVKKLKETCDAMNIILKKREEELYEIRAKLSAGSDAFVMPLVEKLSEMNIGYKAESYLNTVKDEINQMAGRNENGIPNEFGPLTPQEIKIAKLIIAGKSSKDIGDIMKISFSTISFHRNNIRRKLGLKKKGISLKTYLSRFN